MKLQQDSSHSTAGQNFISGHGTGYVAVKGQNFTRPIIVLPDTLIDPWPLAETSNDAASLRLADFAEILALKPELVVFGSGCRFQFPNRQILAAFAAARIGFEVMDTPAACRTYNVLMSEGRRIAANLLIS
jgi:uncharacterized protein